MYLVTGGAGFIGSHITAALATRGGSVRVLDNLSSGKYQNLDECREKVQFFYADIRENKLARCFDGVKVVFHQAAIASVERSVTDPVTVEDNNVTGTVNILKHAADAGVKRVIIAGSAAVYGANKTMPLTEDLPPEPLSPYAVTKYVCEHYARNWHSLFGLETVVLRYFNVFGPRQDPRSDYSGVISRFVDRISRGAPPLIFGDGEQTRDFVYVDNVVSANLLAAQSQRVGAGEVINVGSGDSISVNELVRVLNRAMGTGFKPAYRPERQGDVRRSQASLDRARSLLGYEPDLDFTAGISRLVEWQQSGR